MKEEEFSLPGSFETKLLCNYWCPSAPPVRISLEFCALELLYWDSLFGGYSNIGNMCFHTGPYILSATRKPPGGGCLERTKLNYARD